MADNEWKIDSRVRTVLGNWITDPTIVDKLAQKIVMAAQKHAYGDIVESIGYFQLKGINSSHLNVFQI
jgi:hypothetical protein